VRYRATLRVEAYHEFTLDAESVYEAQAKALEIVNEQRNPERTEVHSNVEFIGQSEPRP
jgi:hypothetical protein